MKPLQIWLMALRPKTLMAAVSPVLMGATLALSDGFFDFVLFFFTLFTALGIQICTNLANDYFDFIKGADTSARVGPVRVTQAGLVSMQAMKKAIIISFLLTAICSMYLIVKGGLVIATLTSLSLLLALIYTAGPYPLAYMGLGDLFVFVFFGPVAVAGTYYLQAHAFSWQSVLVGLAPGAISSAILMTNNLRDVESDQRANKKTLPVRFGKTFGKIQYIFLLFFAALLPYFFSSHPFVLLASLSLFPAVILTFRVIRATSAIEFAPLLPKTSQMLFLYTILFCMGWML